MPHPAKPHVTPPRAPSRNAFRLGRTFADVAFALGAERSRSCLLCADEGGDAFPIRPRAGALSTTDPRGVLIGVRVEGDAVRLSRSGHSARLVFSLNDSVRGATPIRPRPGLLPRQWIALRHAGQVVVGTRQPGEGEHRARFACYLDACAYVALIGFDTAGRPVADRPVGADLAHRAPAVAAAAHRRAAS